MDFNRLIRTPGRSGQSIQPKGGLEFTPIGSRGNGHTELSHRYPIPDPEIEVGRGDSSMFDETNVSSFSPLRPSQRDNIAASARGSAIYPKTGSRTVHEELIEDYSSARSVEALVAQLKKENISLKVAVATYKKAAAGTPEELHMELLRLQENLAHLVEENARLKTTIRELERVSEKENIAVYEEEAVRYKALLKSKEQEILRLESTLGSKETDIDTRIRKINDENAHLARIVEAREEDVVRLETELQRTQSQLDQAVLETNSLRTELNQRRGDSERHLDGEINDLKSELNDREREVRALTAELEASRRENSSSIQLQDRIRQLQNQNDSLKSEQRHLSAGLEAARAENEKLSKRASAAKRDSEHLKSQLDTEVRLSKENEARLQTKNSEIERLRNQLNQHAHQENSSLSLVNEINKLHDEISDLKIRLKASEHEVQSLTRDAHSLERDSEDARGQHALLQQENKRLSDECNRLRREMSEKSNTNLDHQRELLDQLELLESKNRDLQGKLHHVQNDQRWENKVSQAESRLFESESKASRFESQRAELQDTIHELEARCEFYEKEYDKLKDTLEQETIRKHSQYSRDDSRFLTVEDDLRRYREQETQMRNNHEIEKTRLQEQVRSTRVRLEEAEFTIEQLQRENRQKQSELEDMKRDFSRYQQMPANPEPLRMTGAGTTLNSLLEQELAKAKLDAAERDKRQLEDSLEDLQRKLKLTLNTENWEKEDLRQKMKKLANERIEIEQQLQLVERERDGYKVKLSLQKQELEEMTESASTTKSKYDKLRMELQHQQTEAGENTGLLKSKLRKSENRIQELESKLVSNEAQILQLSQGLAKDAQYIEKLKGKIIELKQREQELRVQSEIAKSTTSAMSSLAMENKADNHEAIYYKAKFRDALYHYADCLMMYNFISQEFETFDNWFHKRMIKFGLHNSVLVQTKKPLTFAVVAKFVLATIRWRRRAQEAHKRSLQLIQLKTELDIQEL